MIDQPPVDGEGRYRDCFTCGMCNGSGWIPRDPDVGTDQECPSCKGSGEVTD